MNKDKKYEHTLRVIDLCVSLALSSQQISYPWLSLGARFMNSWSSSSVYVGLHHLFFLFLNPSVYYECVVKQCNQ